MSPLLLILGLGLIGDVGQSEVCAGGDSDVDGLVFSARGLDFLRRGILDRSIDCLERAYALLPQSAVVARDLAQAYALKGELKEALVLVERAIWLGDPDPEVHELHAMILAELGESELAAQARTKARTWQGALIGAAVAHVPSTHDIVELVSENSERGAMASLLLAAHESRRGDLEAARRLIQRAQSQALRSGALLVVNVARDLGRRIEQRYNGFSYAFRLRSALDHSSNPRFVADTGASSRPSGLRLALLGEAAAELAMGNFLVSAALRVDQHVFLMEREALSTLDLTGLALSSRVSVPIGSDPSSAVLGLSLRYSDVFGRLFEDHYAVSVEGGPDLRLRLGALTDMVLGFYGVATDFIDGSPSNSRVSSLNRDRVGQRALLSILFDLGWLSARADAMFLHDNARGDAFDAIGGAASTRLVAKVGGFQLHTGVSVLIREFGPVGESSVIGAAATRTEARTAVELGARVTLYENLDFVLEDIWVNTAARDGHEYINNVISMGLEAVW